MHIVAQTCVKIDANMPREDAGVFVSCADCRVIIFQTPRGSDQNMDQGDAASCFACGIDCLN